MPRTALLIVALVLGARRANAQPPGDTPPPTAKGTVPTAPPTAAPAPTPTPTPTPAPTPTPIETENVPASVAVVGPMPVVLEPAKPAPRALFIADPVIDGAVLSLGAGWYILSSLIIGTGEIQPQQIAPNFKTSQLLPFDRVAVTQTLDPNAATFSNVGLYVAVGYAVLDPILSGIREHTARATLVDAMIYAEAIAITGGATNLSKLAVRRPRPIEYIEFNDCKKKAPNLAPAELAARCNTTSTNAALSFVSGHASTTGAVWGTATYLAFARSPHSWRPWVTLLGGAALTTFVSIERVRSGDHFPSDVVAGAFAGAGVGVLTAHLHRDESTKVKPLWIGWQKATVGNGGVATLGGLF
jgi:membrane-associated phospholipid phosphatase